MNYLTIFKFSFYLFLKINEKSFFFFKCIKLKGLTIYLKKK